MYINPVLLPQVSNREDFLLTLSLYDDDANEPIDLTGWTFQFEIRRPGAQRFDGGYGWYADMGAVDVSPTLAASLGSGITVLDTGLLQILIPEARMKTLCPATYLACLTATDGVNTRQLFIGRLPVLYGGVTN
jgi:hypothetical protein